MFKIGTLADWFGLGLLEGIRESGRCGASGVQIYAWNEFNPKTVTPEQLHLVRETAAECAQEITALCGELGGHGLETAPDNPGKIDYLKAVVDLALRLDCRIVTTHIGVVPADKGNPRYRVMQDACGRIGEYALACGAVIAIETGPEPVARLKEFADACGGGIGINYDPANLVMVTRDDEVRGVYTAGNSIVHTHAKDGRCNFYAGPEEVYGLFAQGGIEALTRAQAYFTETPLGEGEVRWPEYLRALRDTGYGGYLTIEREAGANAGEDIRKAVGFLRNAMEEL
ncbi:MAG: sugar phosphate isomerase/epimerase [Treponema sp.]|jgi:sugar phosphate isomerase/epimerase|nr:sugar phosphate isomerase/epimerase [Treponema sp.]